MEGLDPIEQEAARRLRTALVRPIPQLVADRHLAAMRAARRRLPRWPAILAAAAAVLVAGGAAALPGHVDLPDVVEGDRPPATVPQAGAPAWVGAQDLPRLLSDHATHGGTVSGIAADSDLTGRERGTRVSGAASSKSAGHQQDAEHRPAENPVGKSPGSGDGGTPADTPGNGTGKPENTPGKGPGG